MKQLFLYVALGISFIGFSQKTTQTTFTFNHLQELSENNKSILENIFYGMNDHNYHTFNLIDSKEKGNYPYPRLLAIAKKRALALQNYYINQQNINSSNVKIMYGGEFPTILLYKPKALYTASGEINLEDKNQQCFSYNSKIDNNYYSNNGWQFIFPAYAFETLDGIAVTNQNVNICLWEFTDKKSLVYSGLTTHSGDRMLETGGSFYIKANLNGTPLRLKQGEKYIVKIPTENIKEDMFTYYGNTSEGIIDWEVDKREPVITNSNSPATETIYLEDEWGDPTIDSEQLIYEGEGDNSLYELSSGKLGWINCDRFYDVQKTAPLIVKVDSKNPVAVRLVFRNINSVLPCYATSNHKDVYEAKNIPAGEKVLVLAYSVENDNAIFGYQEVTIGEDKSANITLGNLSKSRFEGAVSELLSY